MEVKLDTNSLQRKINQINNELIAIKKAKMDINSCVNGEVGQAWQGSAHEYFQSKMNDFDRILSEEYNNLYNEKNFLNDYNQAHIALNEKYQSKVINLK